MKLEVVVFLVHEVSRSLSDQTPASRAQLPGGPAATCQQVSQEEGIQTLSSHDAWFLMSLVSSLFAAQPSRRPTWSAPKTAATATASRATATTTPPTEATPPVRAASLSLFLSECYLTGREGRSMPLLQDAMISMLSTGS